MARFRIFSLITFLPCFLYGQVGITTGESTENRTCKMKVNSISRQIQLSADRVNSVTQETLAQNKPLLERQEQLRKQKDGLYRNMPRDSRGIALREKQAEELQRQIDSLSNQMTANLNSYLKQLEQVKRHLESLLAQVQGGIDCNSVTDDMISQVIKEDSAETSGKAGKTGAGKTTEDSDVLAVKTAEDLLKKHDIPKEDLKKVKEGYRKIKKLCDGKKDIEKCISAEIGKAEDGTLRKQYEALKMTCSEFAGSIYNELEKGAEKVKTCSKDDKDCKCSKEAWPCGRLSQKQYEWLKEEGKIERDVGKLEAGDVLFFKECGLDEECRIVHAMFMEGRAKYKDKLGIEKEYKCAKESCPIIKISTSEDEPITKKDLFIKNGCYSWCTGTKKKNKKTGEIDCVGGKWRKQCLVGGGKP